MDDIAKKMEDRDAYSPPWPKHPDEIGRLRLTIMARVPGPDIELLVDTDVVPVPNILTMFAFGVRELTQAAERVIKEAEAVDAAMGKALRQHYVAAFVHGHTPRPGTEDYEDPQFVRRI